MYPETISLICGMIWVLLQDENEDMISVVLFVLIAYLFYVNYRNNKSHTQFHEQLSKQLLWHFGEGSTSHYSLSVGNNPDAIYDRPLIRKLIGISDKYKDKKWTDLPESGAEYKKIIRFVRGEKEFSQGGDIQNFYPNFQFFYDKDLVFTSIGGKGCFGPIPSLVEDYLYFKEFHDNDYKQKVDFIICKRWVDNVIQGKKIEVYTGYLRDGDFKVKFDHEKKWTEKVDILFDFPVVLTIPMPQDIIDYEKEDMARKELAKKFGLEWEDGDISIDGFENDLGNWIHPSTKGSYQGKYFEFRV